MEAGCPAIRQAVNDLTVNVTLVPGPSPSNVNLLSVMLTSLAVAL